LVWLQFDPQAGREQAGRRPALVLSPAAYNERTGLMIACPATNQRKGYPFEVEIPTGQPITGVILADHVKSLDWRIREASPAGRASRDVLAEVRGKLAALIAL
jgi:mRNA interferase MazF